MANVRDERARILRGEFAAPADQKVEQTVPSLAPSATRSELEEVVNGLDYSIDELSDWLAQFYKSAVCKSAPSPETVNEQSHFVSKFGSWYTRRKGEGVFAQPAFEALAATHQGIHAHVRILAGRAWKDAKLPAEEIDALQEKVHSFNEQSRRLAKAFRAALSDLDPLTGVNTRQAMMRDLDRERQRVRRGGQPGVLALADIDHFKHVNDTYGHPMGDKVLSTITSAIQDGIRPYDSVYRYGGEEFLISLPETPLEEAAEVLDRIRQHVAKLDHRSETGKSFKVTLSFGAAAMTDRDDIETITERADQALYYSKAHGRNQVRVWTKQTKK